jgi:hypothetical protein
MSLSKDSRNHQNIGHQWFQLMREYKSMTLQSNAQMLRGKFPKGSSHIQRSHATNTGSRRNMPYKAVELTKECKLPKAAGNDRKPTGQFPKVANQIRMSRSKGPGNPRSSDSK